MDFLATLIEKLGDDENINISITVSRNGKASSVKSSSVPKKREPKKKKKDEDLDINDFLPSSGKNINPDDIKIESNIKL